MWNSLDRQIEVKTAVIILSSVLAVVGLAFVVYLNRVALFHLAESKVQEQTTPGSANITDSSAFVPVNEITPIIKPCMFVLLNSCAKPVEKNSAVELNPVVDPYKNKGDESLAKDDLYAVLGEMPNKGLLTYRVPLTTKQVSTFFPEYSKDASSSAVTVPAPDVIARVAAKYNVNQRVLLVLMEVVQNGGGPLFSSTSDYNSPYYENSDGFLAQVASVALDLQSEKTKYILLQKENYPVSLVYFDKTYPVVEANPESLAIVDFLAQKVGSKKQLEQAIYAPATNDQSGINPAQNFDLLYRLIFSIDPR